jgi:Amt family ammonium transporter
MMDDAMLALAVMLLRVGHAIWLSGSVRSKNAGSMAMRLLLDLAVVSLALWAIGAAFVPAADPHSPPRLFDARAMFGFSPNAVSAFLLLPFLMVITGAVHGAVAERMRLTPILVLVGVTAGVVFPLIVQLLTHLRPKFVVLDNSLGLACVIGGTAALIGTIMAGARKGKFNRDLSVNFVPGHNVVLQLIGVMVVIAGWAALWSIFAGSTVNVLLCVSAAVLAAAVFGRQRFGKVDTGLVIAGAIGGLCATSGGIAGMQPTPTGAQLMPTYAAVVSGALAGVIVPWVLMQLEMRLRLDDVAGTGAAHLVGGFVGLVFGAIFREGSWGSKFQTLSGHLLLASIAIAAAALLTWVVFWAFSRRGHLRVSESAEYDGADLSELDLNAYPDFQQTMIKSHHLREL